MEPPARFERAASRTEAWRSVQLSYGGGCYAADA